MDVRKRENATQEARDSSGRKADSVPKEGIQKTVPRESIIWVLMKWIVFGLLVMPSLLVLCAVLFVSVPFEPVQYTLSEPQAFTGVLARNEELTKAERLFENQVLGPECIAIDKDILYTGTADGKVLKIENGNIQVLARLGMPPCGRVEDEHHCGRPLGMRFDNDGYLIVVDSYLGLHKIDVNTGEAKLLLPATTKVGDKELTFMNDLDISSEGIMYISDTSRWQRRQFVYDLLESGDNGRLIKYDPDNNTTVVVLKGLHFANGVQLSPNEDYILVVETMRMRIVKYYLKGPKRGQSSLFTDNLPCSPDNIRPSHNGGYWIGCVVCRRKGKFNFQDYTGPRPWIRKLIYKLSLLDLLMKAAPKCGMVIELGEDGKIKRTLQDMDAIKLSTIGGVQDNNGVLYMGSYIAPYIAKLDTRPTRN